MERLPWPDYFMSITRLVSCRSTCTRRRVGAVAVKGKRILATGYNGAPAGTPHGIDISGATLYCTTHPCVLCAKMLINCGISRIFYAEEYPDELAATMLREAGIPVERLAVTWPPEAGTSAE